MTPQQPERFQLHGHTPDRGLVDVYRDSDHLITHLPVTAGTSDYLRAVLFCIGPIECVPHSYLRFTFRTELINRLKFTVDVGCTVVRSSHPRSRNGETVLPLVHSLFTSEMMNLTLSHTGMDLYKSGSGLKNQYFNVVLTGGSKEAGKADVLQIEEATGEFFVEHFIG